MTPLQGEAIIIGAGRVGTTLGSMLKTSGIEVKAIGSRNHDKAEEAVRFVGEGCAFELHSPLASSDELAKKLFSRLGTRQISLVFLTTCDDAILPVANAVAALRQNWEGITCLHCSAGLGLEVLLPLQKRNARIAILHPSYPICKSTKALPGDGSVVYSFVGDKALRVVFSELVLSWGGIFLDLRNVNHTLYHAGNVLAAGHVVALLCSAQEVLIRSGVSAEDALRIVCSLTNGVLRNIRESKNDSNVLNQILTGPFVREDWQLIKRHRQALQEHAAEVAELYELLGRRVMAGKGKEVNG